MIADIIYESWGAIREFGGWVLGLTYICIVTSALVSLEIGNYITLGSALIVGVSAYSVSSRIDDLRSKEHLRMKIAETGMTLSNWKLLSKGVQILLLTNLLTALSVNIILLSEANLRIVNVLQLAQVIILLLCRIKVTLTVRSEFLERQDGSLGSARE